MAKISFNYYDGNDLYNDGMIEDELFELYSNDNYKLLDKDELFFYTTEIRKNIINWYPFNKNSKILEIGAGVGPITGALLKTGNQVVSVEGSKRRASIIYERYKNYDNLSIFCGNYNSMKFDEKFDYIVLIGVFEYARIFCNEKNAFDVFFENITKNLKEDGKILIAIENKLGLKYLNGMSEDHFRKPYVGIEGYAPDNKYETFTRNELKKFFKKFGYESKFYGVFPDYKLPSFIFSEDYKPSVLDYKKFTSYNYYNDPINFDNDGASKSIINGNLSIDLSNSFFIEISKNKEFSEIDFVSYQNYRSNNYFIGTSVGKNVVKFPVTAKAINHLLELEEIHDSLNKLGITSCKISHDEDCRFNIEKIDGKTILEIINEYMNNNNIDSILNEIDQAIKYILSISKNEKIKSPLIDEISVVYPKGCYHLPFSLFDLHLNNIIKNKNGYTLIDMEWTSKKQIPTEYNIFTIINLIYDWIPDFSNFFTKDELYKKYNLTEEKIGLFYQINNEYFNIEKDWLNVKNYNLLKDKNGGYRLCDYKEKYDTQLKKEYFDYELLSFYKNELKTKTKEIQKLKEDVEKANISIFYSNVKYNRKIYRIAGLISRIITMLIPYNSFRHKVLSKMYSLFRNFIKLLYHSFKKIIILLSYLFPLKKIKRSIVNKIHSSHMLARLARECYYPILPTRNCILNDNSEVTLSNAVKVNGKIAVHVHMYYYDLSDEFFDYLKNIPFKFDLYISTPRKRYVLPLKLKFSKLLNADKIVVEKSENSGRDFGPMFVQFGKYLKNYDYLLHLHTKKSLRVGVEQSNWRKYLLNGVLGTKETVMQYFELMDNYKVGLAYPSTFYDIPLIAYSWLQNREIANKYFSKCGFKIEDEYLNFSAGSMFWCRVDAIHQLFDLNLTYDDFGEEVGKHEGTLAHAFERIFGVANKYNGYNYATLGKDEKFHINYDDFNLNNNCSIDYDKTFDTLNSHDVITFDLFDTLVTRKVYNPDDTFIIMDDIISKNYNLKKGLFFKLRKESEFQIRKNNNFIGDVNIDEIYIEINKHLKLSNAEINKIKEIEITTDIDLIIPRYDMLKMYNDLKNNNKQIIIITDMYYTKDIIKRILDKCGYYGYFDLLVSSELGYRKDNGTMWEYFYNKYPNIDSIHVGDNDASDIHSNILLGKANYHIINGKKAYGMSKLCIGNSNSDIDLIRGLIINKYLFNSPFSLNENKGIFISSLKSYGYSLLGPVFLAYFQWLFNTIEKGTNLLFISREGYFLQKIYNKILANTHKNISFSNCYFLISRRAVSVPTIETEEDIVEILESYYEGTIKELIYNRLGFMLPPEIKNIEVNSPRDLDYIMEIIEPYIQDILKNAEIEKQNYLKYIESLKIDKCDRNCIIDLGYSGTAQYYLTKLLNKEIDGAYFMTSNNLKPLSLNDKVYSCFNNTIYDNSFLKSPLWKHSLFLEAFLTSNCGQLVKFDDDVKPVYLNSGDNNIEKLNEIFDGICEFINDIAEISNKDILDLNLDKRIIEEQFEKIILNSKFSDEIISTLKIEDLYCSNSNNLIIQ